MIKKLAIALLAAASFATTASADESKITKGYNSMDAMGCMLVRECTKDVEEVHSLLDISGEYSNTEEFTSVAYEFNTCLLYTSPSPRDTERSRMPSSA